MVQPKIGSPYCAFIGKSYIVAAHMKALGEYLERSKITQTEFAARVGVSQPTIANLVNGVHSASTGLLKKICRETGLSADELLADEATTRPGNVA